MGSSKALPLRGSYTIPARQSFKAASGCDCVKKGFPYMSFHSMTPLLGLCFLRTQYVRHRIVGLKLELGICTGIYWRVGEGVVESKPSLLGRCSFDLVYIC